MAHDAIGFTATVITLKFTQFNYFKKCTQMQIQIAEWFGYMWKKEIKTIVV